VAASTQAALNNHGVYTGANTVSIGTAIAAAGPRLRVYGAITGATAANATVCDCYVASDVTSSARSFLAFPSTQAAAFTLAQLVSFYSGFATKGAGSTITSHIGFLAESSMTAATNNYGFYGNIAANTGCWNLYCNGTAQNYLAGNTGIGSSPPTNIKLYVTNVATNTASIVGVQTVQDCVCTASGSYSAFANYVVLRPDTATGTTNSGAQRGLYVNATRNNTTASGTDAGTVTFLRGMEVTYGHSVVNTALTPTTTQAVGLFLQPMNGYGTCTDMYDLYIAADAYTFGTITNHWAMYQVSTTAKNYFAGNIGIGSGITVPTSPLDVGGNSIRIRTASSPTSAATAGNAGEIRWDSGYLYICTTTGAAASAVWKRVALTAI
jgi:hypothetical protein